MFSFDEEIAYLKNKIFAAEVSVKSLKEEAVQYEKYAKECKEQIISLMQESGVITLQSDDHKVTVKNTPVSVIITDENLLPPEFLREEIKRTPNKQMIKDVLASGYQVQGATLSNGGVTLQFTAVKK
jgi:Siphovirus Gp157